ncbi:MAG: 23S rRNA (guanosine(2251)-2'-O)-methyltransferase RlmB [Sporichthyaceae bacterium]
MAGNSQRKGATRTGKSKKGASVGSGGQRAQALTGKGPTPKATERTGHPAARKAAAAARRAGAPAPRSGGKPTARQRSTSTREKKEAGELVVGRNSVLEALQAGIPATALYVAERVDADDRVRAVVKFCTEAGIPLLEAPRQELDRLTSHAYHQGLALQVPAYSYAHADDLLTRASRARQMPLIVALDGVTDPRNLGAVLRSTEAFGGHGVLVPERRAAGMTAGAWKAAAGAGARLPVARCTNLTRALQAYAKAGLTIAVLDGEAEVSIHEYAAAVEPLCLVIGSEGKGVSRLVGEAADVHLRIALAGPTESLNAGVAAGIALYEFSRRRNG